jgi:alkylation response protein AidB-like acyl-CoA dehydrogenase
VSTAATLRGGEFLIRETLPENIFTPEDLSDDARALADGAREFVAKEIWPQLEAIDKHESNDLMLSLLDKSAELGLLSTALPEGYGGLGLDFNTNTALSLALGPSASFGVALAAHTGIGTLPILYFGTTGQKQKYLPKLASGELKAAYCLTEPGSGSDALAAKTKAVLTDDGKHYIVNGQKMWITNGGFADVFIVFVKVDGEQFSCLIVQADAPGVSRGAEERKMGIRGSSTCQVFFENVKVPVENLLGEKGKGHKIAFNILNIGRFKLCAMVTGAAHKAITTSVEYANGRVQFGKAISSFGAIQHKLAEQAIRTYVAESATYWVSDLIKNKIDELKAGGKSYEQALMGAAEEYAIECAMLKVLGSEMLDFVVDEMVQIHGGYGFSEEFPAARFYRDSRINRIFEGTNEINRLLAVDMLVRRALKGEIDFMTHALAVQKELMSVPATSEGGSGLLSKEMQYIANAKRAVLMVAGAAAQKLMTKLEQEQEIVMNVADMMISCFAMEAAVLRARKIASAQGETEAIPYINMAQVFCDSTMEAINIAGKEAITAFGEGDELRMMLLGLKRFTKTDPVNTKSLRREIAGKLIKAGAWCF